MKRLADGVWHLNALPLPNVVNAYLIGDVLIDAGARQSRRSLLRQLRGRQVSAHASLTRSPTTKAQATRSVRSWESPSGCPRATPMPPRTRS